MGERLTGTDELGPRRQGKPNTLGAVVRRLRCVPLVRKVVGGGMRGEL
jgi:hypothetical protein